MKSLVSVFSRKQTSIGSASVILTLMVFASRVLGLVRDRLLSARFAPEELGVYFAAFRLPNLLFEILVIGALTSAFIPIFTKFLSDDKQEAAHRMASVLINISVLVFVFVCIPMYIWADGISELLAPGFSQQQIETMTQFTRFMLLFQVVPLLVGNYLTGILQSYNLFLIPALAPVVYNVGIIVAIITLSSIIGLWAPVVGVGIGAVMFLGTQLPLLKGLRYRHQWRLDRKTEGVREVFALMLPRTIGLAVSQIDTTVDLMLATLLGAKMVTIFNFAQHLQQFPVGLFGATVAQAALPSLSFQSARQDKDQFQQTVIKSLHQILFFILPISVLFIVLRIPVVRLVFGASRFDWEATVLTGMTLSAFSISLFAQGSIHVLARGFYALYNTKTPVIVGIISILINAVVSIICIVFLKLPIWSLGLSTTAASIIHAGMLLVLLHQKIGGFASKAFIVPPIKMFFASAVTGISLYVPLKLFDQLVFDTTRVLGLVTMTGVIGMIGLMTYMFLSWVLGVAQVGSVLALIGKVRKTRAILLEPASEVVNGGVRDKLS